MMKLSIYRISLIMLLAFLAIAMTQCDWILPYSVPSVPKNVTLTVTSTTNITIEWTSDSSRTESFVIERRKGFDGSFAELITLPKDARTYDDVTAEEGTQYSYRMKALGSTGFDSGYSAVKQTITWAVIQATENPAANAHAFFSNPTPNRLYRYTVTVSSAPIPPDIDLQNKWSYDVSSADYFVFLSGGLLNGFKIDDQIEPAPFNGKNWGQFVVKVNGGNSWVAFTDQQVDTATSAIETASIDTPWYGGMADFDSINPDAAWDDNWGEAKIVVEDMTS